MGPHDLLCKWCSTFVGKGKKFCSIFCESRYTRSKRRKLAFKRPVYSSGRQGDKEYESPRSNKTAPAKKESFLEDVITAIENDGPSSERDKRRPDDEESSSKLKSEVSTNKGDKLNDNKPDITGTSIPKLDLNSYREKRAGSTKVIDSSRVKNESKENTKTVSANFKDDKNSTNFRSKSRSKTHTIIVHKYESKIPVRNKPLAGDKDSDAHSKSVLDDSLKLEIKAKRLSNTNEKMKSESDLTSDIYSQALQRQKSKTALELQKKVRSSGYGNPVNPRLRPMALKPRSATLLSSVKKTRNSSAKSSKSSMVNLESFSLEDSEPISDGNEKSKWELIPSTIKEESNKSEIENGNVALEDEGQKSKNSPKKSEKRTGNAREMENIHEMLREESTHSDLLSQTQLQLRLSSIKKKVEVRKRGRDSRSSYGSDLDDSMDVTTDRDLLNTSMNTSIRGAELTKSSRASARSNITRISKQFQSKRTDL